MNDELRDLREFLEGKFERVDERFTTLETAILENRAEIKENRAEIREIQDRLPAPGLDRRVTDLEHRVDALEERR